MIGVLAVVACARGPRARALLREALHGRSFYRYTHLQSRSRIKNQMDSGSRLFVLRAFALASSSLSTRQEDISLRSPFQMVCNLAHHLSQLYQLQLLLFLLLLGGQRLLGLLVLLVLPTVASSGLVYSAVQTP